MLIRYKTHSLRVTVGLLFMLLWLAATSCRATEPAPAPTATVVPFPTFTATPIIEPTATAVAVHSLPTALATAPPTRLPSDLSSLPAPLYFLSHNGQIMRLETDGVTVRQVTTESAPITSFDIDPTGVYLVYVSNNDLIRTTVWGEDRQLLFAGGPLGEPGTSAYYTNRIQRVSFAPDGKRLAFTRNGIQLFNDITAPDPVASLEALLPNGPDPDLAPGTPIYFLASGIYPSNWSPDGKYLFIIGSLMATDGFLPMIMDVQTGQVAAIKNHQIEAEVERSQALGLYCRTALGISAAYWDRAATVLYNASDFTEMFGPPGLSVINTADGAVAPLFYNDTACHTETAVVTAAELRRFRTVYQTTSGALWGFVNITGNPDLSHLLPTPTAYIDPATDFPEETNPQIAPMTMAHLDPATKQITLLRNDSYELVDEILWDAADRGAVVIVGERDGYTVKYEPGRVLWLPSDGAPAVDLGIDARALRWGPAKDPTTEGEDQ